VDKKLWNKIFRENTLNERYDDGKMKKIADKFVSYLLHNSVDAALSLKNIDTTFIEPPEDKAEYTKLYDSLNNDILRVLKKHLKGL